MDYYMEAYVHSRRRYVEGEDEPSIEEVVGDIKKLLEKCEKNSEGMA